ncbi:MAG: hypothetical protein Q8O29_18515 [Polaromonas sp.]|uniref:hypothetical protein n=1 Tax=Polaromonas sp. TaxID=1869339 RepID=UPI0027332F39|nr:hypothetical protein [Polaromonas sp.]MDP2820227.1 hypothetical protein [Polaromonas sp.]
MPAIHITTEDLAIASAVAAVFSALYAWHSARIAKRALGIVEQDHIERHAGIAGYLIDGVSWESAETGIFVALACSLSNSASAPNSIARVELHLHVFDSSGATSTVILKPVSRDAPLLWELPSISVPINLQARSTLSGWLVYQIPLRVSQALSIDRYELVFSTSTGERITLETYLLKRIENAKG